MLKKVFQISFILFLIALGSLLVTQKNKLGLILYFLMLFSLVLASYFTRKERYDAYDSKFDYNYNQENPNALVTGKNIAGTVFASYPNMSGGLGWVL